MAIRDSDKKCKSQNHGLIRLHGRTRMNEECNQVALKIREIPKSVKSHNPWQSVIQTKMHLSESRINQITRKDTDE